MAAGSVVLEAKNITKFYPEADGGSLVVLAGIDFSVKRGEMVSFMGPSGSGKTTLLHICGLLDRASSGDVEINGLSTCRLDGGKLTEIRKNNIGFVYQMHYLFPEFSAIENVKLPLLVKGFSMAEAEKNASDILDRLGMLEKKSNMPSELSGGERQRIAVARAVVARPAIVLADEPTGNLDDDNSGKILDLLMDMLKAYNSSMLIVTHDLRLARRMDRTLLMRDHRILESQNY
ncbi:MAG: ABC transporter ATP-binding protein [Rickettsiales bacterium]|jgi:lipoprotein-releasing system ATP-binding protein|nr:ABC transporter ATP-binding protein [Rickettsiales bacterium]